MSIRFGMSRIAGIFAKDLRMRGAFSENSMASTDSMDPPDRG